MNISQEFAIELNAWAWGEILRHVKTWNDALGRSEASNSVEESARFFWNEYWGQLPSDFREWISAKHKPSQHWINQQDREYYPEDAVEFFKTATGTTDNMNQDWLQIIYNRYFDGLAQNGDESMEAAIFRIYGGVILEK